MPVIEQILSFIAPFHCIECGQEGQILCKKCSQIVFAAILTECALCNASVREARVCMQCRRQTRLTHIWVFGQYDGQIQKLVHSLKFAHARATADAFGDAMASNLPHFPTPPIIVPLPTSPVRIRQRGYDQTLLLARALAGRQGLPCTPLLARMHNLRQVGASRQERAAQAATAYKVVGPVPRDQPIILIDDVLTTGASLTAAADALCAAGASTIMAVVVAKQAFKK